MNMTLFVQSLNDTERDELHAALYTVAVGNSKGRALPLTLIEENIARLDKIHAIKVYRERTKSTVFDAKIAVEEHMRNLKQDSI